MILLLSLFAHNFIIGVEISLVPTSYTVLESDGIQDVCAVLSSATEIPLSLTLITIDGSALRMIIKFMTL